MELKPIDDGTRLIARETAPSVAESAETIAKLLDQCPPGHHPYRIEVQKSSRGRRASVTVTFQRNRLHAG